MRRFLSFRDFDWALLGLVLLLCALSVVEVHSSTVHTKFASFGTKQILFGWRRALWRMFILSKIDYHRVLDLSPWLYGIFLVSLVAVQVAWPQSARRAALDRARPMLFQPSEWVKLVLILAVARYFANLGGRNLTWKEIFKAFGWWAFRCCWC